MMANFTFIGSPKNNELIRKLVELVCSNNLGLFRMLYYFWLIHKRVGKKLNQ